ncbi:uncharacterized protein METZ01_LOCUS468665, partial [marine metagenome]
SWTASRLRPASGGQGPSSPPNEDLEQV